MESLPILFEDNHLLAVQKPFGLLSQGDETGDQNIVDLAKEYIRDEYNKPGNVYVALLHRLDRPVGGVILLAKTSKAAARLTEQFKEKKVEKTYLAITENIPYPMEGRMTHYLKKMTDKNKVRVFNKPEKGAQECILDFKVLQTVNHRALIEVKPVTGRQHQIRAQFAKITCPLVGDIKYGDQRTRAMDDQSIALFAYKIRFQHPTLNTWIEITANPPRHEHWGIFRKL